MISPAEASRTDNVFLLFMTGAKAAVTLAVITLMGKIRVSTFLMCKLTISVI